MFDIVYAHDRMSGRAANKACSSAFGVTTPATRLQPAERVPHRSTPRAQLAHPSAAASPRRGRCYQRPRATQRPRCAARALRQLHRAERTLPKRTPQAREHRPRGGAPSPQPWRAMSSSSPVGRRCRLRRSANGPTSTSRYSHCPPACNCCACTQRDLLRAPCRCALPPAANLCEAFAALPGR